MNSKGERIVTNNQRVLPLLEGIQIADFRDIYHVEDVLKRLEGLQPEEVNLRKAYNDMITKGPKRLHVKPSGLPTMTHLYEELPNFSKPLDAIKRQLALCLTEGALEITPMLLLGDPGIGKTLFAHKLAKILYTSVGFIPMSSLTAGWILSGSSSQWKNSRPGKVFETLVKGCYANPVIIVDEIDKAGVGSDYDPLGALYSLLECDTAREFTDEFAEVPVDASLIVWIATANNTRTIPEPILNRMDVYEIPPPTHDQSRSIALQIYCKLRAEHSWGKKFNETPSDEVLDQIADLSPHEMYRVWKSAFGNACLDERASIKSSDLQESRSKKQTIGFRQ